MDAWQMYRQTHRRLHPRQYTTLTEDEQENFVKYWEELYSEEHPVEPPIAAMLDPPTATEIIWSMNRLKNKKAAGPDGITAELLIGAGQPAETMTIVLIQRAWSE